MMPIDVAGTTGGGGTMAGRTVTATVPVTWTGGCVGSAFGAKPVASRLNDVASELAGMDTLKVAPVGSVGSAEITTSSSSAVSTRLAGDANTLPCWKWYKLHTERRSASG